MVSFDNGCTGGNVTEQKFEVSRFAISKQNKPNHEYMNEKFVFDVMGQFT